MNNFISKFVSKALREVADKIDSGNCELTEEQAMDIMSVIGHEVLSKTRLVVISTYLGVDLMI